MPRLVMYTGQQLTFKHHKQVHTVEVRHIWYGRLNNDKTARWYAAVWDIFNKEYRDFAIKDIKPND